MGSLDEKVDKHCIRECCGLQHGYVVSCRVEKACSGELCKLQLCMGVKHGAGMTE